MEPKTFYHCPICGALLGAIEPSPKPPICCGQPMEHLTPGTTDAPHEKHVPIVTCEDRKTIVTVGEIPHPMSELHYIEWIYLQTSRGGHMRRLYPGEKPEARFRLCASERPVCAFAYCNLHGLWRSKLEGE